MKCGEYICAGHDRLQHPSRRGRSSQSARLVFASPPHLRLETGLDRGDGTPRPAGLARHEEDTVLLAEERVGRFARLARNVSARFHDCPDIYKVTAMSQGFFKYARCKSVLFDSCFLHDGHVWGRLSSRVVCNFSSGISPLSVAGVDSTDFEKNIPRCLVDS